MRLVLVVLVLSCSSGCVCSSRDDTLPDAHLPRLDGGPDGHVSRLDGSTCDDLTGEGCPCATEGETRGCVTGGVGACGMGAQRCEIGFEFPAWSSCGDVPEASDETCNGVDDDCDGSTDEDLGELSCGDAACATTVPACASGVPQTCVPLPPRGEECNLVDDDCDGAVDEDLGSTTCGVGTCERTVAGCTDGVEGLCVPGLPAVETCNGLDDDCDGTTDEDLGTISCGVGECARTVVACVAGTPRACTPRSPSMEVCDGLDNDCNGMVDDGFGTTVCGLGECRRVVVECSGGPGGPCVPGTPSAEVCDGRDNDCDGMTDEGIAAVTCGVGACARTQPACVGGMATTCTPGMPTGEVCNGVDDDCDGLTDEGLADLACGTGACRRTAPACVSGRPGTCTPGPAIAEVCGNRIDDDCDGMVDELCSCDPGVDRDFDGFNQCTDCDDTNGAIYPGRSEVCNGIDDDCDGLIDETFDTDGDGFSTCSTDPLLRDCDDTRPTVYPGAPELCLPSGAGDGIDQDCDGYVDEVCTPCDTRDDDGDGVSECAGDCDDTNRNVSPRAAEQCDGLDTDCNVFTVDNCGVSDRCNWPGDRDVCRDDLLCGCVVTAGGTCTGNYVCTSFCQGSFTGPLGAGCSATQSCFYRVTLTDNQHGCAESTGTLGTLPAGSVCTGDTQCRSGNCDRYCVGPGCSTQRCVDYCDHHEPGAGGSCAAGTVCEILRGSAPGGNFMYARCALDDNGTRSTGAACSASATCIWGTQSCVSGVCAAPCGLNAHCTAGYHCSLRGNAITVGTFGMGSPPSVSGMTAIETVPVCLSNTGAGLHNRQAGAACGQNGDCASQFCERTARVCVDLCTTDASCPTGLGCELAYVRAPIGVLSARVCLSASTEALLTPM